MKVYVSVENGLPPAGDYMCKVNRNDKELIQMKRLFINQETGRHAWMGGCRPFCENDVVTHYEINSPDGLGN